MSQYDVYAIGNALVDYEFEIKDDDLKHLNIDKGRMTLIECDQHHDMLEKLGPSNHKRACGGSAANTIIALSQFGGKSFYSCRVANDEAGKFYQQDLHKNGVTSNLEGSDIDGVTGKCLVLITPDIERSMCTYLGVTADFSCDDLVESALVDSQYLYVEGYLVASKSGCKAAIEARKIARAKGIKVALTFSDPNMVEYFKEGLLNIIDGKVDLLFCNEAEARLFFNCLDVKDAAEQMQTIANSFVITLGAKGALIYDGHNFYEVPGHPVKAVDSNGAGDMYAGAFLYGITHDMSYQESGKLASLAASELVTAFGPRLQREQTQTILEKFRS